MTGLPFPDLSPEIFTIGGFSLRWYALAYILGLVAGWRIVVALMRRPALWPADRAPMEPARVEDLLTAIILGVILGGRLGYVLFYQPAYFLDHPLDIVKVWHGGMAFHGGFLGVVVAALWFCRRHGIPPLSLADALALATPPGLFLGRIANFINAELWGRPTSLPWGVRFPGEAAQTCPGIPFGQCARHPSQLYEAGLEGLVLMALLLLALRAGWLKAPGRIAGLFVAGYGAARFAVEFVRQADAQFVTPDNPAGNAIQFLGTGLSMGQLLSLPMIALGLWLILRARPAPEGRTA
ncbi:prolipoprotein diacylglyceryl transferase [Frigidibacter oleivorans]|uniref:prolipoprotein diacylglyceryl transferase n=1 Tax=Frigidibacter oleivorans TaxID=2487129 RepID=UPI000F8D2C1D|nr:prolipoprotein diacylglyceryl transferase [Frigidibacter oleivorans]